MKKNKPDDSNWTHLYAENVPLHHFQVGALWSLPSLVTEGLRDDKFVGKGEKPKVDGLCWIGGGGLATNAVNMPVVPKHC